MMTPLQFETQYVDEWRELEALLSASAPPRHGLSTRRAPVDAARLTVLYRRACEHLAIARARSYPAYLVERLEELTTSAHQAVYRRHELGPARIRRLIEYEFPRTVRRQASYVVVAALLFVVPTVVLGVIVYRAPDLILSIVSTETAASFDEMYSPAADSIGRTRTAATDWLMFGYYIRNNIGVAFQCFAGGLFAGVGTLLALVYNGAFGGAVAGYLTARGLGPTFYAFVATHSAFELTAIVIAGGAGLRLGHALLAPGRLSRRHSLVAVSHDCAVLLYGVMALLIAAAAVEAFWSSARGIAPAVKYGVAAVCWATVLMYLTLQGRREG